MKADASSHLRSRSNSGKSSTRGSRKPASLMVAVLCAVSAIVAMPAAREARKGETLFSTAKGTIPYGKYINLSSHGFTPQLQIASSTNSLYANTHEAIAFLVVDKGAGRVALFGNGGFLSADSSGIVSLRRGVATKAETFQWGETATGELTLLSLNSHRYLLVDTATGAVWANGTIQAQRNTTNEIRFDWKIVAETPNQSPTRELTQ
jgi:hypothetical protein